MNSLSIKFLGAAQTVTGSCFLLKSKGKQYIIDCGMFQGPDVYKRNYLDFDFKPSEIDSVFITHSHLDHCGLLPKLVKQGYEGNIYCTQPTTPLLVEILTDSAKVQKNNYKYRGVVPLYDSSDTQNTLNRVRSTKFNDAINIHDINVTFRKASHILGASSIEISTGSENVIFSGDLGRRDPSIIEGYDSNFSKEQNVIIMESLYGNKEHENRKYGEARLCKIIQHTIDRNGNVIIPVFAIQRHQEIISLLVKLIKQGKLPNSVQIFSDTPLGHNILDSYTNNSFYFSKKFKRNKDPFGFSMKNINFVNSISQSRRLRKKKGVIILAGSGMLEGGRIINHIRSFMKDPKSSFIIVGFQAEGTLGREIIDGATSITLNKKQIPINAKIHEIYSFSAHADKNDLLWWLKRYDTSKISSIFLVHSKKEQADAFKKLATSKLQIKSNKFTIPSIGQLHEL
ncbi:MBL fold metallo-hydrolase [Candidatus Dojkabacteria bacterium]|nr:MBL fold metallo-hydrolase [Candidatus Dojkabacteria bacterium]